jgi:quercetin dioxygenase-like cupin family protein
VAYPRRIDNGDGEVIVFERRVAPPEGDWLELRNEVQPGRGPVMHVHHRQAEQLTVLEGRLGYQVLGEPAKYVGPGDTVSFAAGVAHRFWADGPQVLRCRGRIEPVGNVEYFLTELYRSMRERGGGRPGDLDVAYLMHRFRSEFDMFAVPAPVKAVLFPVLRAIGHLTGRYRRFADAPSPLR